MAGLIGIDASRAIRPIQTGTERYSAELIRALLARPGDRRFRLYFDRSPRDRLYFDGRAECRVISVPRVWTHLGLGLEVARRRPDTLFVPSHVLPIFCPVPSVATIHDVGYLWHREAYSPLAWLLLHLGTRRNCRADRVIADSQATARDLMRHFGVASEKIRVAHLGGPPLALDVDAASARATYRLPERYFLFVGTLQPRKNLPRLLRAFAEVAESDATVALALAGPAGRGAPSLQRLISALNLDGRVHLLGYVPVGDLPGLFAGAIGFVFPSLYEGFGMPALEAMAWGTPVIAATTGSLPEVVGDAGLLVDPYDTSGLKQAMERLLEDSGLRERSIVAGRARVASFTWDRCAEKVEAVLDEVLA